MSPKPREVVVRLRNKLFLSFLIWQLIPSTIIFLLYFSIIPNTSFSSFPLFLFSQFIFSVSISLIPSPFGPRKINLSLAFLLFVPIFAFSWSVAALCLFGRVGFRGFLVGAYYGVIYVDNRRWLWVLEFPFIQRHPLFTFKRRIPFAAKYAYNLSIYGFFSSAILSVIIPDPGPFIKCITATREFVAEQIVFFVATFAIFFCWELTHTLHRVLHTKRFIFAPPKASAAAEKSPSELLLSVLEESNPTSLLRYHAYLDLCMVSENNVDAWRRAAFFEETGETYKRVIAVCLRPLEQLASRLGEDLGNSADKPTNLSNQLSSPTDVKHIEELDNFQPYAWCSRIVASLTARSRKEDKFGVAQLSGNNAAVVSTLISCLLAVENFMGKKTNLQSPNQLGSVVKRENGPVNSKAYAIADVLKTSIYQIVSAFHDEMLSDTKSSLLEKDWITSKKPLFGFIYQEIRICSPKGSAAAVTNPSDLLLSALEESNPTSLLRYHAYLDLCMVSENNVDAWRRAAFFEETGETYKRVIIAVCLRPLEQLASILGEDLGNSADKPTNLSNQLSSPTDVKHLEELDYFQCSKIVASLTACSRKEDKFGVAQLSGSNAAVVSTLISCLLAVENFMGKKTNLQSTNQLAFAVKRKNGHVNSEAYAIADVLKTSIYQIVSAFHDQMLSGTKSSPLEKDWITSSKPLYGTREMLIKKLRLFLVFQAT